MRHPKHILDKADEILSLFHSKQIKPRVTTRHKYLVLNVGPRYRLVNKGREWELMTHETYNKRIDK